MRTGSGLQAGMHPIAGLDTAARNAMHFLNSAAHGYNQGDEDVRSNARISKGSSLVTLSFTVRKDQEILLNYAPNQETKITTSPRDAYPLWIAEAAARRIQIPVWSLETKSGPIYFVVPEERHPLPLRSVSLAPSEKDALLRSVVASGGPTRQLTRTFSVPPNQKVHYLACGSENPRRTRVHFRLICL